MCARWHSYPKITVALIPEELLSIRVDTIGAENRVVERGGVLTDPSGTPDGQAHPDVNRVPKRRRSPVQEQSTSASWAAAAGNRSLTVLRFQAMNVWTAVNSNATGNEISATPDTTHNWLSLRRLRSVGWAAGPATGFAIG